MIKNCNECNRKEICTSHFGGLGCKYIIRPSVIALLLVFVLSIGTVASATSTKEEAPATEETIVIDAEAIGIKTIEKEVVEDEVIDSETENKIVDEVPVYVEEEEEVLETEEEDLSEPPEGMVEGYESGVYFPINYYDCEMHEDGCYRCEECTYETSISYDEEADTYMSEKWCTVCGHMTCEPIAEEEIE